nr:esterase-like activity of phytase family protein [Prevotella sp.]
MRLIKILFLLFLFVRVTDGYAQISVVRVNEQVCFPSSVPCGNYSGIVNLHNDVYAVINDKSDSTLWFRFKIEIDSVTGQIRKASCLGPGAITTERNLDGEAITKVGNSLYLTSESLNRIKKYPILENGSRLGNDSITNCEYTFSNVFQNNYGLESLTYDTHRHLLWTAPENTPTGWNNTYKGENNIIPLIAFDENLNEVGFINYSMDAPEAPKSETYAMGVSELCSIGDNKLLVLERELYVAKMKIGSFVQNKIFYVDVSDYNKAKCNLRKKDNTEIVNKRKIYQWRTKLNITSRSFANYEGMCVGPKLKDGSLVIILVADSQNQYAGALKDWFKTIVIK